MERTAALRFEVDYVRDFNHLPDGVTFNFLLVGVQSVRSLRYTVWPGTVEIHAGMPREEQSRRVAEYQAKWREESEDWSKFESAVNTNDSPEVSDATLVSGSDAIALHLGLLIADGSYREVFIRAESLEIGTSDGLRFTLAQYLALGEAYWAAFAARRGTTQDK
jgi:hypothetical protein